MGVLLLWACNRKRNVGDGRRGLCGNRRSLRGCRSSLGDVERNADSMEADEDAKGKDEAWAQLEEQLWRRWELLGVCHAKTGDRKVRAFS